jgi:hypothetical protein
MIDALRAMISQLRNIYSFTGKIEPKEFSSLRRFIINAFGAPSLFNDDNQYNVGPDLSSWALQRMTREGEKRPSPEGLAYFLELIGGRISQPIITCFDDEQSSDADNASEGGDSTDE